MLRRTASPIALSLMRAMNFFATAKSTSASSSARRICRSAASIFSSLIFPWPRRSLKISCSLSPSCENKLFLRSRARSGRRAACAFFDTERPVRLDFLVARFGAQNHCAGFVAQLLRHLIRHDTRLRIITRWNDTESADTELNTGGIDLSDLTQVSFDQRQRGA